MSVISFAQFQIVRAGVLLDAYRDGEMSRAGTKVRLMTAFDLGEVDVELVLQEVDAE
jgi:hypothetical protein